jgi:hypothetical protein
VNFDALLVILSFTAILSIAGYATARALRIPYASLGAATALALWLALSLAYAMPFGWAAPVGEVAALGTAALIGLTAYLNRKRARFPLPYTPLDLALFGVMLAGLAAPALVLPVPLDTDAQGFGYLALTAMLNGDLTNLAPLNPEIDYLYAPGFTVTVAYFAERLGAALHTTQFAVGAVLAALVTLVVYDFGRMIGGVARARAGVVALFIGFGLLTAYMDSHYTSLYGLALGGAYLLWTYALIVPGNPLYERPRTTFGGGVLTLAALVLVHPDTTIIIGLGVGPWLLLIWLANPRPTLRRWLTAFAVPVAALVLLAPWLLSVADLLGGDIASPFERNPTYWRVALGIPPEILYHGVLALPLALIGAVVGLRRRSPATLLAVGWMVFVLEFAAFGLLERVAEPLVAPVLRYDYPFSIAWHGPILPFALLGGAGLAWGWARVRPPEQTARQVAWGLLAVTLAVVVLFGAFNRELLAFSKGRVTFFGAFASEADVTAMTWLRENTPPDAYILNFPGPQEGDWVPVIAERRAVYYRPQPFFDRPGDDDPLADTPEQVALRAFWADPADPDNATLLTQYGVTHIIVPEVVADPASFADHWRWRRPFTEQLEMTSAVADAPYLTAVFANGGAQVYAVR